MLPTPIVLGHEAAGVVEALGAGVVNVTIGEPVMVGSQTPCGQCASAKVNATSTAIWSTPGSSSIHMARAADAFVL